MIDFSGVSHVNLIIILCNNDDLVFVDRYNDQDLRLRVSFLVSSESQDASGFSIAFFINVI